VATNEARVKAEPEAGGQEPAGVAAVHWDDSKMATNFANVVNIQSTLEQVDLFFGTNQTWSVSNDRKVNVELNNRIILSPHAAKRLWHALGDVLKEYESRHGALRADGR
jgi:hypothetical protein